MFIAILAILISFLWLMRETNNLTIQLPTGGTPEPEPIILEQPYVHPKRIPLLEPCKIKTLKYPLFLLAPVKTVKTQIKIEPVKHKKQKLVVLADRDYQGKANRKISSVRREMNLNDILDEALDASY